MSKRPSYDPRRHSPQARGLAQAMDLFGNDNEPPAAEEIKGLLVRACDESGDNCPDPAMVSGLLAAYRAARDTEHELAEDAEHEYCPVLEAIEAEQLYHAQYAVGYKHATKVDPDPENAWFPDGLGWEKGRHYPEDVIAELGFNKGCQDGREAIWLRDNHERLKAEFEAKHGS